MTTAFQPSSFQSDGFQIDGGVAVGAAITGTLSYTNNNDFFSGVAVLTVGVDLTVLGGNVKFKPVQVPVEAKAAPLEYNVTNMPDAVPPRLGRGLTLGLLPEVEPAPEIVAPEVKIPTVVARAKPAAPLPPEPPVEPLPEPAVAAAPPPAPVAPPSIEARVEDLAAALAKATKQLEALQARVAAQVELAQTTAAELAADEAVRAKREQNRRRAEALTQKLMSNLTS